MRATTALLTTTLALAAAGCASTLPELPPSRVTPPTPAQTESVLFLIGDAGYLDPARHPIVPVISADIERTTAMLARDSAVAVLFLGDNVYPLGLHPPGTPEFPVDSLHLQAQVDMLAGPFARRYGTVGYFIAGNHDWGEARDEAGVERLRVQEAFLRRRNAEGIHVELQPEAGEPGPAIVDVGSQTRILIYDTAWWLLADDDALKGRFLARTEDMIRSTRTRNVVVAAHHPMNSAGSHAGIVPFWKTFGVRYILARSGAILQDLNSIAYRELLEVFLAAFAHRPPLLFVGGHDHSLQIIAESDPRRPRWHAVSGSGSKVSGVGHTEGMVYRAAAPGYMKLVTHRSGRVDLVVVAADDKDDLECTGTTAAMAACMADKIPQFRERYSLTLKEAPQ